MALQKQNVNIPFAAGLDLKTDPFQLPVGHFLSLENIVFQKGKRIQKRNAFKSLASLPSGNEATTLTTYKGNLTAIGSQLYAYSSAIEGWENKGRIQPVSLSVLPLVRTAYSNSVSDAAISTEGLVCVSFLDGDGACKYQISDSTTGETLVNITALESGATLPRCFLLPRYFIITYLKSVAGTPTLRYIAVPTNNITSPSVPIDISTQVQNVTAGYDGYVVNDTLYMAWSGSDGGGAIRVTFITQSLTQGPVSINGGRSATRMSVTADSSGSTPVIWVTAYDSATLNAFSYAFNQSLVLVLAATQTITVTNTAQITSTANNGVLTLYYSVTNTYSFSAVPSHFIRCVTCTQGGSVGAPVVIARSVGLASKAFIFNNTTYVLTAYAGSLQPSYFLIDSLGNVVAKLAYSNGGGYPATQVLPSVTIQDDICSLTYSYRFQLQSVNKSQNAPSVNGIYAQTGINLVSFDMDRKNLITAELGSNLNIAGGVVWAYDGVKPVEQGFNLWPEDYAATMLNFGGQITAQTYNYVVVYEWTDGQGNLHRSAPGVPLVVTNTNVTAKSFVSANVNIATDIITVTAHGFVTGMEITFSGSLPAPLLVGIPYYAIVINANEIRVATTYANAINNVFIDITTNGGGGTKTITPTANAFSNTLNIPTLRLTYKTAPNVVRIVVYRWSTAQQSFYQITSVTSPLLNNPSVDSVTYTDTASDASIIGNTLLYTTGGVLENIAPPSASLLTLFKNRLFLVDAENPNLLWYSKLTLDSTPVEMSDLLTQFVSPTVGAQGDTGVISALAPMDDKLIIFKEDAIYYMTGNGPDNTGANNDFSEPTFITAVVGCVNQKSIVFTPQGLLFQSDKGIWLLGRGLNTTYVGAAVEDYNNIRITGATGIPDTNQVRFLLEENTSATLYQGQHTVLNGLGQVLQETEGEYVDDGRLGTALMFDYFYEQWGTFEIIPSPVLIQFSTSWLNLSGVQGFERAYWFHILGEYLSKHKLHLSVSYDYNPSPEQNVTITPDNNSNVTYGNYPYGSESPYGGPGRVEQYRVFMKKQKCQAFQIHLKEVALFEGLQGAGLTLSGMNITAGIKGTYPRLKATKQVGLK